MKLLYEASNSLEAHMILNLLEQERLTARLDGEHLQGGLGELPAVTIRVMIEEAHFEAGKKIIDEWIKEQPSPDPKASPKKLNFGAVAVGFFGGVIFTAIYLQLPINVDGIDYNSDGKLDETWETHNYQISKTKLDRNLDGKFDLITKYTLKGHPDYQKSDEDFNGTFETKIEYRNGNPIQRESDTEDVGVIDYIVTFENGILETETYIDIVTRKPAKINYFGAFGVEKSEIDSDRDGQLDTIYEYDAIGEIVKQYKKDASHD